MPKNPFPGPLALVRGFRPAYDFKMRKIPVLSAALAASLVCACSSISKKQTPTEAFPMPPSPVPESAGEAPADRSSSLDSQIHEDTGDSVRYFVRYAQGKIWAETDPAKSCDLFLNLSTDAKFPLHQVARLRAIETCPSNHPGTSVLAAPTTPDPERWLKEPLVRASLARAVKTGDTSLEMRLSFEVALYEPVQKEQIRLLERAQTLARDLKDPTFEVQSRSTLEQFAPRLIAHPRPEQLLSVATDFRKAREFHRAREIYRTIVADSSNTEADRMKALDGIRMSYKLEKDKENYIKATRAYAQLSKEIFQSSRKKPTAERSATKFLDAHMTLARAVWTENQPKEAEAILLTAERDIRGRVPVDESILLRARILEEAGSHAESVKLLEGIGVGRISDRDWKMKVFWHRAWNLRKIGRLDEAAELFQQLASEEQSTPLQMRNRFWLARTLKEAGQADRATAEFEKLIEIDQLGYYGLLSYRELGRLLPAIQSGTVDAASEPALNPAQKVPFAWLAATGENDLARRYLDFATSGRRAQLSTYQALDLLRSYARVGGYQSLFGRLFEISADARKQILSMEPQLVFPRPWYDIVEAASKRFDVRSELILSIMRQESSFNPFARSHMDAFGLMQLIPEMAKKAASDSQLEFAAPEELYKPKNNIPLGAAFLKGGLQMWGGRFIPTVASYNASEDAVRGWLKTRDRKDPVQFIEDIPYEETRTYVKLVMRNFIYYSRLNTPTVPIEFPGWCLDGLQDINP